MIRIGCTLLAACCLFGCFLGGPYPETVRMDYLRELTRHQVNVYFCQDKIEMNNGLISRSWRLEPNGACVAFHDQMTDRSLLRAVRPEARVTINGISLDVGGLVGQPNHAYLLPEWLEAMQADPAALRLLDYESGSIKERFPWKKVRHCAADAVWPPQGEYLRMEYGDATQPELKEIVVSVHYQMYDGLPLMSKWLTVSNHGADTVTLDRFTSEILAVVEEESRVESRPNMPQPVPTCLHVETDFAFGGGTAENANRHAVHWRTDPLFTTQVNYRLQTPCQLEISPTYGPAQEIQPGETFVSFRTFELVQDSSDRERRGLARRRMMRTIAPWVTENPLMMHMRSSEPGAVREAIDQCAAVGFEMLILSFGSGFNMESEDPAYLAELKSLADYAREKGVEIGGYSLLSSRRIGGGNDVVSPEGISPAHGNCPALTSAWGQDYYRKLYAFFGKTGFTLLEHDGPYPGDLDTTARPPLQTGLADSRWAQWRIASRFYAWCRGQGIYLNAPDYYYLDGTSKCGMGYREVNWSLPREQQVIHTRQNIFDGTWNKTPSMGWMFVPLTEYHGGGAPATIEPLDQHRDHYAMMLNSNLALGVQACYRGPRLFDTPATEELVRNRVAWFKKYRAILESDLIHGRRADGRSLDWMLHVNPLLEEKGMLVVFNPLDHSVQRRLRVNLYYTGLNDAARISCEDRREELLRLSRDHEVMIDVQVPAQGMTWYVIRA